MNETKSPLLLPFIKLAIASSKFLEMTDEAISNCETEAAQKEAAKMSMTGLTQLFISLCQQLDDIIADRPCQCESCIAERADALAQAEEIFK